MLYKCYGTKYYQRKPECRTCECKRECGNAGDPKPLRVFFTEEIQSPPDNSRLYSSDDITRLVRILAGLDSRILKVLLLRIEKSWISKAEIARELGISRQTLQASIVKAVEKEPVLRAILFKRR